MRTRRFLAILVLFTTPPLPMALGAESGISRRPLGCRLAFHCTSQLFVEVGDRSGDRVLAVLHLVVEWSNDTGRVSSTACRHGWPRRS